MRILRGVANRQSRNSVGQNSAVLVFCFLFTWIGVCQSGKSMFLAMDSIQLAAPRIQIDSILFKDSALVTLNSGVEGSVMRYSTNGSEVSEKSMLYQRPLSLSATAHLKIRTFHPEYQSSEVREQFIYKIQNDISGANIRVFPDPNENYEGDGSKTLVDNLRGTVNFRNGKRWLGFQVSEINIDLELSEATTVEKVVLGTLLDQGSWIFLPDSIKISSSGSSVGTLKLVNSGRANNKKVDFVEIPIQKGSYKKLNITIVPLREIPDWHPGKGTMPWVFLDEVLIE